MRKCCKCNPSLPHAFYPFLLKTLHFYAEMFIHTNDRSNHQPSYQDSSAPSPEPKKPQVTFPIPIKHHQCQFQKHKTGWDTEQKFARPLTKKQRHDLVGPLMKHWAAKSL